MEQKEAVALVGVDVLKALRTEHGLEKCLAETGIPRDVWLRGEITGHLPVSFAVVVKAWIEPQFFIQEGFGPFTPNLLA